MKPNEKTDVTTKESSTQSLSTNTNGKSVYDNSASNHIMDVHANIRNLRPIVGSVKESVAKKSTTEVTSDETNVLSNTPHPEAKVASGIDMSDSLEAVLAQDDGRASTQEPSPSIRPELLKQAEDEVTKQALDKQKSLEAITKNKSKAPIVAILVAIVISLILIGLTIYAYLSVNKAV